MTILLDVELAREWFSYNKETGVISLNKDRGRFSRHKK